jgi:hypothetical protein
MAETSNLLLDRAYAYAKQWGSPALANRCVSGDHLNLDPLRKALAEAWLAGHEIARLSGETSAALTDDEPLFVDVSQLLYGWKSGCAPGEWTEWDEQVLQRWSAFRMRLPDETTPVTRSPDGYAHRRHNPFSPGETYITFDSGHAINGSEPIESIPYWLGPAPPTSFPRKSDDCKHENADLRCSDCGIDFRRTTVKAGESHE